MAGVLTLCATPIGNLGDAAPRLTHVLADCDVIYAEDTRRAKVLLDHLGVDKPVRSYFVGNEQSRSVELAGRLADGAAVALITDAGTPSVADPGVSAVRAARDVGASVSIVPGPSAVTAAVAVSGFGADRFVFEGFLPRRGGDRRRRISQMAAETRTVVFFSAPRRLTVDLEDLAVAAGSDRRICVTRELTKRFEEVWWGTLGESVIHWSDHEPRGEFTLVLAPGPELVVDVDAAVEMAREFQSEGAGRSEAARRAAAETGVSRRDIYERM